MAKIRHFVKPHWIESIINDGVINVETWKSPKEQAEKIENFYGFRPSLGGRLSKENDEKLSELKGNQVWFTDARRCNTASKMFKTIWKDCYFEFDTDDIPVRRWHHYKKDILKNKPNARKVIVALDKTSEMMGDNPYNYWVSDDDIDISLAKRTGILSDEFNLEDIKKVSELPKK
jgi:hypothetical protein